MSSKKASFVLSIDLELAWGVWDKLSSTSIQKIIDTERLVCENLLNIFEENEIPVTWAVVAALLDNKNKMMGNLNQKAWYAPDILDNILNSKIKHLITSHSYGHKEFNTSSKEEIIEDFEKSNFFLKLININADVFIFPRNQVFHLDVLSKFKFKTYRSVDKSWYKKVYEYNKSLGKISNLIDKIIPIKTNSVSPLIDKFGLTEIPTSILLISKNGIRAIITNYSMFKKVKEGIDLAIKRNECFHIWFHPSNFYYQTNKQFDLLKKIIHYVNLKRDQGLIEIKLLNQFN
jgi:peptidoglycan/xylan/chitin deacetylase (PgdA/CDA1 family)